MLTKAIVLSYLDFRILINDMLEIYHTDFDTEKVSLEEYFENEFLFMLESYECDKFIVFIEHWVQNEKGDLLEVKKDVYELDHQGMAWLVLDYLRNN